MSSDHTFTEIRTQVDAWQGALDTLVAHQDDVTRLQQHANCNFVLYVGCGSTYYLALAAASLTQTRTRIPSRGVPASELLFHPASVYPHQHRALLVAISRSATTTETVRAVQEFRGRYSQDVLAISCYDDRLLNLEAALTLAIPAGQEQSIAQTRSFSAMLVIAEGIARILDGNHVGPDRLAGDEALVRRAEVFAKTFADPERYDQYFYLGSGPRYGLACEAMLKMKEMTQTCAEAYHPLEFRHGPKAMVNERTVVVGLLGEEGYDHEKAVLDEMRALGATTITLAARPDADFPLVAAQQDEPLFPSLVRYMPLLQWMAYHRAIEKKLDPDHPHNLDMVVQL